MAGKSIILNLLISVVLVYGVIRVPENTWSEQLRDKHKKLPAQTVTTEDGDVYDCIDFYEQPAFEHPLLKKHDYHFDMKPSFALKEIPDKTKGRSKSKGVGCPRGTVPIRRTDGQNSQTDSDSRLIYYAGTKTKDGIGKIYGASSWLSTETPKVYDVDQFSSSIVSIEAGHEFLHAGWTVNPKLFGDHNTRFYIWMHAANASCYNVDCPGFVITNHDTPLNRAIRNATSTNEIIDETKVLIHQEQDTGHWWLVQNYGDPMGFWPYHLFKTLSGGAYKVYFGGVVAASPGKTSFPQMGGGHRPNNDDTNGNAVCRYMRILNQNGVWEYAADKSDILETLSERYVARNHHMHWYNRRKYLASTLLFGGA